MIEKIQISNYKCIDDADLELKPLTIIAGPNSTGKSTLLQAILLPENLTPQYKIPRLSMQFNSIRCKYIDNPQTSISVYYTSGKKNILITDKNISKNFHGEVSLEYGNGIYYLSANRSVDDSVSVKFGGETAITPDGKDAFATYEVEKNKPVIDSLIVDDSNGKMLSSQVNYWLSYILGQNIKLFTTISDTKQRVDISYTSDDIEGISPSNLGTGVSYLAEVLITCLRSKKDYTVLIENPEIHLHPAAQSRLGEFLTFIANAGIQVIVETHCEHMINRIRYEVSKQHIKADNTLIYYKSDISKSYEEIKLNKDGQYCRDGNEGVPFPEGFFDATLSYLRQL